MSSNQCPFKQADTKQESVENTTAGNAEAGISSTKRKTIVVAFSGQDIEKSGVVVRLQTNWDLDDVKQDCGEKLSISGYNQIEFYNEEGEKINSLSQLMDNDVVYIPGNDSCHQEIPTPPTSIFFGTLPQLLPDTPGSLRRLYKEYKTPILQIYIFSTKVIATNHPSIAEVIAQESEYFTKKMVLPFAELKAIGGEGLFTTNTDEKVWKLAHKILIPAFSNSSMKTYAEEMGQLALKLCNVLGSFKPDESFLVTDWMTRITFETIGMVGFGYDFKVLDSRDSPLHPFIEAMSYCLTETKKRTSRSQYWKKLPISSNHKFDRMMDLMKDTVDEVITRRKKDAAQNKTSNDLLSYMLEASDKSTGEKLTDNVIRDEVVTLLIAGHETTSNTLSWCLYLLARHPAVLKKVIQEIVNVGINDKEPPTISQVSKLKYTNQVLKETLRMYPPVSSLQKYCIKDCILPLGYKIEKDTVAQINIYSLHYNPDFWPEPEVFNPDRFSSAEESKRHPYAWLPFSSGPRACLGTQFALQEAKIVLATMLRRFEFHLMDNKPVLYATNSAALKPENFYMRITRRTELPESTSESPSDSSTPRTELTTPLIAKPLSSNVVPPKLTVLFGSNMGLSEEYANKITKYAIELGFKEVEISPLDEWSVLKAGRYEEQEVKDPNEIPIILVVTSTYNGLPPDNAKDFDRFISVKRDESDKPLKGLRYTVFGCGNKQWRTYQVFPGKVNEALERLGADQIFPVGAGDADGDIDADFSEWIAKLYASLLADLGMEGSGLNLLGTTTSQDPTVGINLQYITPNCTKEVDIAKSNIGNMPQAQLVENKELQVTEKSHRSTRHLEIELPEGTNYSAGDHLEIAPENRASLVEEIAMAFGYALDAVFEVKIDSSVNSSISSRSLAAVIKGPCTIRNALTYYADLLAVPSRQFLGVCVSVISEEYPELEKRYLEGICQTGEEGNKIYAEFAKQNRTLLDLIHNYPMIKKLDFLAFLCAMPVMSKRRYSIASSPLVTKNIAHICVAVVEDSGFENKIYPGLCSSFLANSQPGVAICAHVKPTKDIFHLPEDPTIPVIMACAGTGIAPFRGFLQERQCDGLKSIQKGGRSTTHLFFGCRSPEHDFIYRDELEGFESDGTLDKLHLAFSRVGGSRKYVQHELLASASLVWDLLHNQKGAFYVCGSASGMAKDVASTLITIIQQIGGMNDQEAKQYFQELQENGKYNEDVWG
ncbi:hypothetical protein K7432_013940 [Basidiobolus ranarum]|uniref:NADPH--hemoprotein reductase n=1 Tax=Basidiobolus ranarum TaxID=34480 RepID=A0ABR2VQ44_9FUNG